MDSPRSAHRTSLLVTIQLSIYWFLYSLILSLVTTPLFPFLMGYRNLDLDQVSVVFLAVSVAGTVSGYLIWAHLADRWFRIERVISSACLAAAGCVWWGGSSELVTRIVIGLGLYSFFLGGMYPLGISLSLRHLWQRDRGYSVLSLVGAIGGFLAGILLSGWITLRLSGLEVSPEEVQIARTLIMGEAFRWAALLLVVLGLYAFTLPATPPPRGRGYAPFVALAEAGKPAIWMILALTFLVSMIDQAYTINTSPYFALISEKPDWLQFLQSVGLSGIGWVSIVGSVVALVTLAVVLPGLSKKTVLLGSLGCFVLSYVLLAIPGQPIIGLASLILHGGGTAALAVVVVLKLAEESTEGISSSIQGLGVVPALISIPIGSYISTSLLNRTMTTEGELNPSLLLGLAAGAMLAVLVALLLLYPRGRMGLRA